MSERHYPGLKKARAAALASVAEERAAGLAYVKQWKARRYGPTGAADYMPFADHRDCSQWSEAEA